MNLTLHIGMPKTGTSAIQSYISKFPDYQLKLPLGPTSLCLLFGDEASLVNMKRRLRFEDLEAERVQIRGALRDSGDGVKFASSEFLFEAGLDGDITKLRQELNGHDVKVVLYVRHPMAHFPSFISQRVRAGAHNRNYILSIPRKFYNFSKICSDWAAQFDLTVVDYGAVKANLIRHFCETTGFPFDDGLLSSQPVNPSLGLSQIELARRINSLCANPGSDKERRRLIDDIQRSGGNEFEFFIPDETREELRRIAAEQNLGLVGRFLSAPLSQ